MANTASTTEYGRERIEVLEAELEVVRAELKRERAEKNAIRHECEAQKKANRELGDKFKAACLQISQSEKVIRKLTDQVCRLQSTVESFRNGSRFENLRKMYESDAAGLHRQIRELGSDLAEAGRAMKAMRENWIGVLEDYERQIERERKEHAVDIKRHEERHDRAKKREE